MNKGLFNGFNPVSTKQWKQKIQFDLDGADFNSTLIWNSNEAIAVKPFYNADDLKALPKLPPNNKYNTVAVDIVRTIINDKL